jgi:hypothetical protein
MYVFAFVLYMCESSINHSIEKIALGYVHRVKEGAPQENGSSGTAIRFQG